jgi:prevent-host-death family protein
MKTIGIRELRQNASRWLRLVEQGESFEITDRGRAVALLVPTSAGQSTRERLIRAGRLSPGNGHVLDVEPLPLTPGQPLPSEILAAMRDDER